MPHQSKTDLIICHSISGRLRLKALCVRSHSIPAFELEYRLNRLREVRKAEVRCSTGSIILRYDPGENTRDQIIDLLIGNLHQIAIEREGKPLLQGSRSLDEKRDTRSSGRLAYHIINVLSLTLFMAYAGIRHLFFRSPVSQTTLSAAGVVAVASSVPLLFRAVKDLRSSKRVGLFPFLAVACGMAVIMGEVFAALEIIWVLSIGILVEESATERARREISRFFNVFPNMVLIFKDGVEIETDFFKLQPGNIVVVRTGDAIPCDGTVIDKEALVDEAHITGRSLPELRRGGDQVYAGTKVLEGALHIRAEKTGDDTFLSHISRLVEDALSAPTEAEKKADILATRLTGLGLAATLGTFLFTRDIGRSLSVMLVMSCPCATVLAASTAIAAAIINAARHHILIKGGIHLEQVNNINCYCFDKTGTLTSDIPEVIEVVPRAPRQTADAVLLMAACAESLAEHPIAKAVIEEAEKRGLSIPEDVSTERFLGRGVCATSGPDTIIVGNSDFLEAEGVKTSYFNTRSRKHMGSGHSVIFVARNHKLQGMIAISNAIRPGLEMLLGSLRKDTSTRFYLVSGDMKPIVRDLSNSFGFDGYRASLLPEEKAHYIDHLEGSGSKVLMVGDGVNDALALSRATVGVAMGAGGSEVAIEAADIALSRSNLNDLVFLQALSAQTSRTVEQNFWIAMITNILSIQFSALGFLSPFVSGLLHIGHSLCIILNSSRLLAWSPSIQEYGDLNREVDRN